MKFFKYVTHFGCIFCRRDFEMTDPTFKVMNKHGWGCCADCWTMDLPNATAANTTYIPPNVLAAMHNDKGPEPSIQLTNRQGKISQYEKGMIVEQWLQEQFKPKEVPEHFTGKPVICQPLIQHNRYIKTNETVKTKVNGVTFRYMDSPGMTQTKNYQVLYKILNH